VWLPFDQNSSPTTGIVASIRRLYASARTATTRTATTPTAIATATVVQTAVAGGVLASLASGRGSAGAGGVGESGGAGGSVVILLHRTGTRSLTNHAAVLVALAKYFSDGGSSQESVSHVVDFHALSFAASLALFRRARLIVGPHGSGFVNMMWATAASSVTGGGGDQVGLLEIVNSVAKEGAVTRQDAGGLFGGMASMMGHKYCVLPVKGTHKDDPMEVLRYTPYTIHYTLCTVLTMTIRWRCRWSTSRGHWMSA
jgi:hypothetical protein